MNISIFGLGYVGCVSTGCLAQNGHKIIGVDINEQKVALINDGKPTIIEKDITEIIEQQHAKGLIHATTDYKEAILNTDISFICVGTPSLVTGQLNLSYVLNTAEQIGESLGEKDTFHVIAIRSTVFPGTNGKVREIIEEKSGKKHGNDFAVISNPEFLREGSAVDDYYHPALTVLGGDNEYGLEVMKKIYSAIDAPIIATDVKAAEMIKYINNSFHALKISFANEVGNICQSIGIDPFEVMRLFKMDDRLNISTAYFNPGMAYGGSCLPKDLRGLATIAHDNYVKVPVIEAIGTSNELQHEKAIDLVQNRNKKDILLFGLAFKKGTDDLRYSPSVRLAESLIGKGYNLKIYDKYVYLAKLTGANKSYIEQHLPHISALLEDDLSPLIHEAELIIVTHQPDEDELKLLSQYPEKLLDFVRLKSMEQKSSVLTQGLSW